MTSIFLKARKKNGQHIPGRIVVHDRAKVESEILPRYFNHASFASLRRQLNYFAFTRVGKGKQKGATYCNEKVIDLLDILSLKRRVVGSSPASSTVPVIPEKIKGPSSKKSCKNDSVVGSNKRSSGSMSPSSHAISVESKPTNSNKNGKNSKSAPKKRKTSRKAKEIIDSVVPVVHLPKRTKVDSATYWNSLDNKKARTNFNEFATSISPAPVDSPLNYTSHSEPQITLDLTKPLSSRNSSTNFDQCSFTSFSKLNPPLNEDKKHNTKEEDVLAGCSALLALGCQSSS